MNMTKTKIMWFNNKPIKAEHISSDVNNYSICIDGTNIGIVNAYTYLGVELDCLLSFDKHLDSVVNKVIQTLYIFRKIRRFISIKLQSLYTSKWYVPYWNVVILYIIVVRN